MDNASRTPDDRTIRVHVTTQDGVVLTSTAMTAEGAVALVAALSHDARDAYVGHRIAGIRVEGSAP